MTSEQYVFKCTPNAFFASILYKQNNFGDNPKNIYKSLNKFKMIDLAKYEKDVGGGRQVMGKHIWFM